MTVAALRLRRALLRLTRPARPRRVGVRLTAVRPAARRLRALRPRALRRAGRPWLRRPRPGAWSLRRRLVASCVALVAVVCAVIGAVTIFALHDFLYGQLDAKVRDVAMRASGPPGGLHGLRPGVRQDGFGSGLGVRNGSAERNSAAGHDGSAERNLSADRDATAARDTARERTTTAQRDGAGLRFAFLAGGGQDGETVGAVVTAAGRVTDAAVSATSAASGQLAPKTLRPAQAAAFAAVPRDGHPHTLHVPGLGTYRVESSHPGTDGSTVLVGLNTAGVQDTLSTLLWVEVSVTTAGLVAAGLAGAALMRIALQPLRRVAATATRVSELPLHRGEVALHERVPDGDTDPRTEVGQVGAALNRMLGHVGSALHARQESETRVRQFVADASHELRTPLASIRGYAELTRRGRESAGPDTRHALSRIESEAARMTTLVEDLLLLARLDAGRPLSREATDLLPLVVDAVGDARAAGRAHHWRLELPDAPAYVRGDPQRLHQVLANLLANARTHTPPGTTVTARVVVRGPAAGPGADPAVDAAGGRTPGSAADPDAAACSAADPAAGQVELHVEDDGPGIPADLRDHVFERFARGDASRSRSAGSTGLGLAIVRSVVAAHGGGVAVDSTPGRTVFSVTLPAAAVPPDDLTDAAAPAAPPPTAEHSQVRPSLSTSP